MQYNMNFYTLLVILGISSLGIFTTNFTYAVDPLSDVEFLQNGVLETSENQFHVSDNMNIREFFNGDIIRISGQTIEGFPYITYSKMSNEKIDTRGVIFINNQFVRLSFVEKPIQIEKIEEKNNDLDIIVQYTQSPFKTIYFHRC